MIEEVRKKFFENKRCSICKTPVEKEELIRTIKRIRYARGPIVLFRMFSLDEWNPICSKDESYGYSGCEPIACDKCLDMVDKIFKNLVKHNLWDNAAVQQKVYEGDVESNIQLVDLDKDELDLDLIRKLKDYL